MSDSGIEFKIGDGEAICQVLTRLMGSTVTVKMASGEEHTGDIIDGYADTDDGDSGVSITAGTRSPGHLVLPYDRIVSIEYV